MVIGKGWMEIMLKGLQTHFNATIGLDTLKQVHAFGFETVRIDAMESDPSVMLAMIAETTEAGLIPLVIVDSVDQLDHLSSGLDVEWTNEPDGDISPSDYFKTFKLACDKAKERGIKLWAPAISNLDEDSLKWLNDLRVEGQGWPDGLYGISVHRYGDGSFNHPHRGFSSRDSEVKWLKAACQGKPFIVTEVGYPVSDPITEEGQAEALKKEFTFWEGHGAEALFVYQLNDGPGNPMHESFGIRRVDGSWKPSAYLFNPPTPITGESVEQTVFAVRKSDKITLSDGKVAVRYPKGSDTVLSIQPNGSRETRPLDQIGAWETATDLGNRLAYEPEGYLWLVVVEEKL
jgi:hypothetical protein